MSYRSGFDLGSILNIWADMGIFAYALPFLMIFAIVYGILAKTNLLGDNKGVNATIALAVGLLSLQFDYVSGFYASIFPYAGMGIAVLLVALILMGLVFGGEGGLTWIRYIWFGIGAIIFIIIIFTSVSDFWWLGGMGYGFANAWPAILAGIIIVALLGWVVFSK